MTSIVQKDDPVLREVATPVSAEEFGSPTLLTILEDMRRALDGEEDGAAIAAPQIGVSKRIFVISKKVFGPENERYGSKDPHFVFINPKITKLSRKLTIMDEGCLSVRGMYGNIKRAERATIEAFDEYGQPFVRGAGGLLAQVFQHEVDHLNGTLFIDQAEEVWRADPNDKNKRIDHE
jgi:peptide deformylase